MPFLTMENKMFRLAFRVLVGMLAIPGILLAQTTNITGVINTYTPVLSQGPCANVITVGNSAGFSVGDTVLIIQMQGALIDQTNTAAYGTITNYNGAGSFEKGEIQSIAGNTIYLVHDLMQTYNFGGKVQMVSVPVYQDANVTGSLTGLPWDGNIGGVVVLDVRGTLNIVGSEINMNLKGFRGGALNESCPNSCSWNQNNTSYFYGEPNYRSSLKGEGISEVLAGYERGRGAQANGGGGGNDHNAGGGGGSNLSAGGIGSRNNEPGVFNCKGYNPGEAGHMLDASAGARVFMGGGGGAGHGNNSGAPGCQVGGGSTAGTNGGGIIIVMANTLNAFGDAFRANSSFAGMSAGDGAGGGGAGGTVLLDVNTITATPFTIHATGGNGGPTSCFIQNRCYGPGGGGAGGAVYYTGGSLPGSVTTNLAGGTAGIITSSSNACNGTSGTAAPGVAGTILAGVAGVPMSSTLAVEPCILPVEYSYFSATAGVQNTVWLDWATTSELSNDRFDIERATDALTFTHIGTLPASAQDGGGATYRFIDRSPVVGGNWYRLRQFDKNGRSAISEIRHIRFEPNAITLQRLYPNPVGAPTEVSLEILSPAAATVSLTLLNVMGQQVYQASARLESGLTTLRIPTQGLRHGIYFLRLHAGTQGEVVTKLKVN